MNQQSSLSVLAAPDSASQLPTYEIRVPPRRARLPGLDEARAVAIGALILAHFAPAILERGLVGDGIATAILLIARFATPGFIVIFGVSAGLVYAPDFAEGRAAAGRRRLRRRVRLLLISSLLVAAPGYAAAWRSGDLDLGGFILASYGILTFYLLAVCSLLVFLPVLAKRPSAWLVVVGTGMWAAGVALAMVPWIDGERIGHLGLARLYFVSGAYAYLPLMGSALLVIPIGAALRRGMRGGGIGRTVQRLAVGACAAACLALAAGYLQGELQMVEITSGRLKAPPRPWYFALFGSTALLMFAVFYAASSVQWVSRALTPVRLVGQCALPIYVAHAFVLPLSSWLESRGAGVLHLIFPVALFLAVVVFFVMRRHLQNRANTRAPRQAGRAREGAVARLAPAGTGTA